MGTAPFPGYSRAEHRADAAIHAVGLCAGVVGAAAVLGVVVPAATTPAAAGLTFYAPALVVMLGASAAYNLAREPGRKLVLRRLDHAAIFVMIAGTYSPFALAAIGGPWGVSLFAANWGLAVAGALHATIWPRWGERAETAVYLLMGWSILLAVERLIAGVDTLAIGLLLGGGVIYTLGVILHNAERLPFHNALWHACVLTAAACHYLAIWTTFA